MTPQHARRHGPMAPATRASARIVLPICAWLVSALLAGCATTDVRIASDATGAPVKVHGSVVLIDPDIELYEVAAMHARKTKRRGKQTRRLRRKVEPRSISSANNNGEAIQCFAVQTEFFDHDIERAKLATMAPEDAFDVERRGMKPIGRVRDLGRRDKQKHS